MITGGHSTPAVACIEELQKRGYRNISYVGQKKTILFDKNLSSEYKLITNKFFDIRFYNLIAGKLSLFKDSSSFIWFMRLPIGFLHAFFIILMERPKIVLSFGGHLAVPIAFWAFIFRIPIIIHEQTTTIGKSNYFIQKLATKVCISWSPKIVSYDYKKLDKKKCLVTGNPIRKEVFVVKTKVFNFYNANHKTILVMGGNQGSHFINEFLFKNIYFLIAKYNVIHQTGSNSIYNDYQKALKLSEKVNEHGVKYIPVDYIFVDQLAEAYFLSDLVICRSGANTVVELISLKKKAVLIPIITSSGDEQFKNAKIFEKTGLGKTILQSELNIELLLKYIEDLISYNDNSLNHKFLNKLINMHKNADVKIINVLESILYK